MVLGYFLQFAAAVNISFVRLIEESIASCHQGDKDAGENKYSPESLDWIIRKEEVNNLPGEHYLFC
jgi:hypothetical protein